MHEIQSTETAGVSVTRAIDTDRESGIEVGFHLTSSSGESVVVRVTDDIPAATDAEITTAEPEYWAVTDEEAVYERILEPDDTVTTWYTIECGEDSAAVTDPPEPTVLVEPRSRSEAGSTAGDDGSSVPNADVVTEFETAFGSDAFSVPGDDVPLAELVADTIEGGGDAHTADVDGDDGDDGASNEGVRVDGGDAVDGADSGRIPEPGGSEPAVEASTAAGSGTDVDSDTGGDGEATTRDDGEDSSGDTPSAGSGGVHGQPLGDTGPDSEPVTVSQNGAGGAADGTESEGDLELDAESEGDLELDERTPNDSAPSESDGADDPTATDTRDETIESLIEALEAGVSADQRSRLQEAMVAAVRPRTSLEVRVQHLQSRIETFAAYTDAMEAFLDDHGPATELLDELSADMEAIQNELAEIQDAHVDTTDRIGDLEAASDRLETQFVDLESTLSSTVDRLEGVETEQDTVADRLDRLEDDHRSTTDRLDDLAAGREVVDDRLEELAADRTAMRSRLETTADRLTDLESQVDNRRCAVDSRLRDLEETLTEFEETTASLQAEIDDLTSFRTTMQLAISGETPESESESESGSE